MTQNKKEEIENRTHNEIIVDAYDGHEVQMGWYYYMKKTEFPLFC